MRTTMKLKANLKELSQLTIYVGLVLCVVRISAECNVCQQNQVACINSTSFYLCFGENIPNTQTLYHCKDGFDCSDLTAICVQRSSQRPPSCGDTSQCGQCSAHRNYLFACLSHSTFQMCYGAARPEGQWGYCPTGYICNAESDAICVPAIGNARFTCDIADELIVTTTMPPINTTSPIESTPPPTTEGVPTTPLEVCNTVRRNGLFAMVPPDPNCRRYIQCYYRDGVIRATEYNCSNGSFFNAEREMCTTVRPTNCN